MCEKAKILVIDDEWIVIDSLQYMLENLGYDVVAVTNGEYAREQLVGNPCAYAAIITDIDLGQGIDGWCLARIAREAFPSIAVIYCTGQPVDQWRSHGQVGSRLVPKPFTDRDLADALENVFKTERNNSGSGVVVSLSAAA